MSIFKVVNVGQGDCILIEPPSECQYSNERIFVDLGNGNQDISRLVNDNQPIEIVLTHSHSDHINGFKYFIDSMNRVQHVFLPLYQNEIVLIAKAILNLKGINTARDCQDIVKELNEIVGNQIFLKHYSKDNKLLFLYQGRKLCDHIVCLNPPLNICPDGRRFDESAEMKKVIRIARDLFEPAFADSLISYFQYHFWDNLSEIDFDNFWINDQNGMGMEMNREGRAYVLSFFLYNYSLLSAFNSSGSRKELKKIYKSYVKHSHEVCIVLKASYNGSTMLLTGDASKEVFYRLLIEGEDISAEYLKVPHHGSKNNIDAKILNYINPRVCIISHKNGKFGKAKDTHPNQEVIDMMKKRYKLMITNDVTKNGEITIYKKSHSKDSRGVVEIVEI